ncbi:(2Fe-2S)-binding protein [Bradyrhizobium sp. CNPSo 4019]|uniref:Bacterioferritin-associated ferredoxin n=2 Tax=Bradyrhizobium diversitatis TaxID=2755406 RepID=A0ABS0NV86_9BRAD|nr:(2Fe-2S)-binding protein [Bradyrhizobium diversitatis]
MIVCSCNIISDHDIRGAVGSTDDELFSAAQVYDCLGCTVRCGRCSQSVRRILEEQPPRCVHGSALTGDPAPGLAEARLRSLSSPPGAMIRYAQEAPDH